jgi:hypothetical protein
LKHVLKIVDASDITMNDARRVATRLNEATHAVWSRSSGIGGQWGSNLQSNESNRTSPAVHHACWAKVLALSKGKYPSDKIRTKSASSRLSE